MNILRKNINFAIFSMAILLFAFCVKPKVNVSIPKEEKRLSKDETLTQLSFSAVKAIQEGEISNLIVLLHPTKGVLFSPYAYIDEQINPTLSREQIGKYYGDSTVINFGVYDGSGDLIRMDLKSFLDVFISKYNFTKAPKVSINQYNGTGNSPSNILEKFPDSEFVEYYYDGFNKVYEGMDWQALRIVWEKDDDSWYIIAIIKDCWTI